MSNPRSVLEGEQIQGQDEAITYTVTVDPAPTGAITAHVYDVLADYADVTATVMPAGSAQATGNVITLPQLTALTRGRLYRVEVKYVAGVDTIEVYIEVKAER